MTAGPRARVSLNITTMAAVLQAGQSYIPLIIEGGSSHSMVRDVDVALASFKFSGWIGATWTRCQQVEVKIANSLAPVFPDAIPGSDVSPLSTALTDAMYSVKGSRPPNTTKVVVAGTSVVCTVPFRLS